MLDDDADPMVTNTQGLVAQYDKSVRTSGVQDPKEEISATKETGLENGRL